MINKGLKEKAASLPLSPGVYLMKDREGGIIYVGKSKHLKKRVSSYFGYRENRPRKVERMIRQIEDFEYIVVDTELDALLLECQLIKQLQPIYNRLLKNDSRYRYIQLNESSNIPFFESTYDRREEGTFFGPYDMKHEIDKAIEAINKYYLLADCKSRPMTESCIRRLRGECMAPCLSEAIQASYGEQINKAVAFLKNETEDIIAAYENKMQEAAVNLAFEEAQIYKEYHHALRVLRYKDEAARWNLYRTKTIALLPMDKGGFKVYCFMGAEIKKTLYVKTRRFQKKWLTYFDEESNEMKDIQKSEMDRAYIIYNYLHRNDFCQYYEVEQ